MRDTQIRLLSNSFLLIIKHLTFQLKNSDENRNAVSANEPSMMEMVMAVEGSIYRYGFEVTPTEVSILATQTMLY